MSRRALLYPLSMLYRIGLELWNFGWKFRRSTEIDVPVISVGNLTVGGSGKTPLTIYLAGKFLERRLKPAVLIRGYRRKEKRDLFLLPEMKEIPRIEDTGDEAYLIFRRLSGKVPVGIGRKRERTARFLLKKERPDLFLLDDGFQYRKLHQDVKIVILNVNSLEAPVMLLPAGDWREPLTALKRADILLFNFKFETKPADFSDKVPYGKPSFKLFYRATGGVDPDLNELSLEYLKGKKAFAFAGIAEPHGFLRALETLGTAVVGSMFFPDHHWYSERDLKKIARESERSGAEITITTEKDLIKIGKSGPEIAALRIEPFLEDEKEFWKLLEKLLPLQPFKSQ
ncbi:MAG: tetraacyldisaccharide 4'-kinase [Candidatus Hydrothermota bacterium]|nr:MAG: tetraacyldisaccharide 4'-kinase [Candidatus Hydrothermae bacterium]